MCNGTVLLCCTIAPRVKENGSSLFMFDEISPVKFLRSSCLAYRLSRAACRLRRARCRRACSYSSIYFLQTTLVTGTVFFATHIPFHDAAASAYGRYCFARDGDAIKMIRFTPMPLPPSMPRCYARPLAATCAGCRCYMLRQPPMPQRYAACFDGKRENLPPPGICSARSERHLSPCLCFTVCAQYSGFALTPTLTQRMSLRKDASPFAAALLQRAMSAHSFRRHVLCFERGVAVVLP